MQSVVVFTSSPVVVDVPPFAPEASDFYLYHFPLVDVTFPSLVSVVDLRCRTILGIRSRLVPLVDGHLERGRLGCGTCRRVGSQTLVVFPESKALQVPAHSNA
ncbi:hypothetical protein CC2G_012833 [Coprinopsis cinerea AmutBmut pab1-1]|nr:hypothetical protein CC2G_012833 [Coprinopsis cinerea AmutBmut pab1-1]